MSGGRRSSRLSVQVFCVAAMLAAVISSAATREDAASRAAKVRATPFSGVNLATGGFANDRLPGRYGFDYVYPDRRIAAPFIAAGMTVVRLPVLWERVQRARGGPLDDVEMQRIDAMIKDMASFEVVILDIHNFGTYFGERIDRSDDLKAAFADLWRRLALRYKGAPNVAFGLMNEPNGMSARAARALADAAVGAIRQTGSRNLLLVPGTNWTGAHSWTAGGADSNADAFADFRDPANRFVFELHDYLDADASGTKAECPRAEIGVERLSAATEWLRKQGRQAVLGEFGSSVDPLCLEAMDRMLRFIDANSDVWMGWTYWAAGGWWGDYFMSIQPDAGETKPQMKVLMKHIGRPGIRADVPDGQRTPVSTPGGR